METGGEGGVSRAVKFAGAVGGLVVYLYLLGGAVFWLHLATARLSGDAGLSVVDSRHLLLVGCRVAVFELLVLGVVSLVVAALVGLATLRIGVAHSGAQSLEDGWGSMGTLLGMIAPGLALLGVTIGLSMPEATASLPFEAGVVLGFVAAVGMVLRQPSLKRNPGKLRGWFRDLREQLEGWMLRVWTWRSVRWLIRFAAVVLLPVNLVVGAIALPLLQGTTLVAGTALIYLGHFLVWPGVVHDRFGKPRYRNGRKIYRGLLSSNGVWVAVGLVTLVALAWVYTPPVGFSRVVLTRADGQVLSGGLVSRDGDTLLIAECDASHGYQRRAVEPRMTLLHVHENDRLEFQGGQYWFDSGDRPSLYQALRAAFHGSVPPHASAPLQHSLRGTHFTCGASKERH